MLKPVNLRGEDLKNVKDKWDRHLFEIILYAKIKQLNQNVNICSS